MYLLLYHLTDVSKRDISSRPFCLLLEQEQNSEITCYEFEIAELFDLVFIL